MSKLPNELSRALRDLAEAIQQSLSGLQEKPALPMRSRTFMADGVHVYYRCVYGPYAGARYASSGMSVQHLATVRRTVVIANITLGEQWRGRGFFKALVAALREPRLNLDLIEVENVLNERLAEYLARDGWRVREWTGFMGLGESWFTFIHPET